MEEDAKCVNETANPLLRELAPGDLCDSSSQCFGEGQCKDGVCVGKEEKATCLQHKDCNNGLYCLDKTCAAVKARGEACSLANGEMCAFGTDCFEDKCVPYGTIRNKKALGAGNNDFLCSSFYADNGWTNTTFRFCTYPPTLNNEDDFERKDPTNLDCEYTVYVPETADPEKKNMTAKCGFNQNDSHYCPKLKGEFDFRGQVEDYQKMWNNTFNCHVETTKIYCKDVKTQGYRKLFADWLKDDLETESESSYALYANNADCTHDIINAGYWAIRREADSAILTTMSSIVVFMFVMLYLS